MLGIGILGLGLNPINGLNRKVGEKLFVLRSVAEGNIIIGGAKKRENINKIISFQSIIHFCVTIK